MEKLVTDLTTIKQRALAEEDANVRFRQFIKYRLNWSDRRLDETVLEIVREVEAAIDCTQCANCCRVLEISLEPEDIAGLAAHLNLSAAKVEAQYAREGNYCEKSFAHRPCAFLQDNRCSLYPARPATAGNTPTSPKANSASACGKCSPTPRTAPSSSTPSPA